MLRILSSLVPQSYQVRNKGLLVEKGYSARHLPSLFVPSCPQSSEAGGWWDSSHKRPSPLWWLCHQPELSGMSVMLLCGHVTGTIGEIRWPQRAMNEVVIAFEGKES